MLSQYLFDMVSICTSQIRSQIHENVRTPCYIDIYLINVVGWVLIRLSSANLNVLSAGLPVVWVIFTLALLKVSMFLITSLLERLNFTGPSWLNLVLTFFPVLYWIMFCAFSRLKHHEFLLTILISSVSLFHRLSNLLHWSVKELRLWYKSNHDTKWLACE